MCHLRAWHGKATRWRMKTRRRCCASHSEALVHLAVSKEWVENPADESTPKWSRNWPHQRTKPSGSFGLYNQYRLHLYIRNIRTSSHTFCRESRPECSGYYPFIWSNGLSNRAAHEPFAVRAFSSEPTLVSPDSWLRISLFCPYGCFARADVSWCGIDGPNSDWWFSTGIELYLRLLGFRFCIVDLCFGYLRNVC